MPRWTLAEMARLRCRATSEWLGDGPSAEQLAGQFCLVGTWADGTDLVGGVPLLTITETGIEKALAALAVQPELEDGADAAIVGGGWFGWLGYDETARLTFHDHLLRRRADGWYFEALWSAERDAELSAARDAARRLAALPAPTAVIGAFGAADREIHLAAVERAVGEIRAGEIYQVNVCTRLSAPFIGDAHDLFSRAVARHRPSYGGYVAGPRGAVVSLSPELFLRRRGRDVTTAPIKGTAVDRDVLRASAKDAAENVMIVDLMRNDLGRVCETGSVRVAALLDLEPHPGLWHLVSRIDGRLRRDVDDADLLRATFPPGSVTGAPKLRAVEIIDELESSPRGVYTGAIGFCSPSWGAEFSVAIRTFEVADGEIALGVGGGITADSVPMLEWRECLDKAAPLLRGIGAPPIVDRPVRTASAEQVRGGVLETVLAVDGLVFRLGDHLARLDRSVRELYRGAAPSDLAGRVRAAVAGTTGRVAVRIRVGPNRDAVVDASPLGPAPVAAAARTVVRRDGLWRHKWADRRWAAAVEARAATPLLVAADDAAVLETSRGNIFLLKADGTLVTPPLRDDLLAGVTRRALLDRARDEGRPVELRSFDVEELLRHAAFWTSSLSMAVPVHSVDGVALVRRDDEVGAFARGLANTDFVS